MRRRVWATVAALCAAWFAQGGAARAAEAIPPAVVRIMAAEHGGASFGSGSLVAVNERYGLVITNWHVVRDTNGFVVVSFPDGFRSAATVVRVDRDWDLAALAIQRPNVAPVPLAAEPPRPGDWLAIAGYGKGNYRMATGRCTQYLSPGGRLPYEMVEVGAAAREGDSGGPIFNQRGELAGVLFGTGMGRTMGSYCGRVRWFVEPLAQQMQQMDQASGYGEMITQGNALPPTQPQPSIAISTPHEAANATPWMPAEERQPLPLVAARPVEPYARPVASSPPAPVSPLVQQPAAAVANLNRPPAASADAQPAALTAVPGSLAPLDRFTSLKSLLAIAGAMLLTFHAVRFLGRAVG